MREAYQSRGGVESSSERAARAPTPMGHAGVWGLEQSRQSSSSARSRNVTGLAVAALDPWPATAFSLYTSGQVRRIYLSVATRSVQQNSLGLTQADALVNVRALSARLHFLE